MGRPSSRSLRGRVGAYEQQARYDTRATTAAARAAFLANFEVQVDPEHLLPVEERQRRAAALMKSHMARLALQSAMSRSRAKQKTAAANETPPTT